MSPFGGSNSNREQNVSPYQKHRQDVLTLQSIDSIRNKLLTACEMREQKRKNLVKISDCAASASAASPKSKSKSKITVQKNETFEEMTKDLLPCYASPCTKTKKSEARYRRRSIERRGAISHIVLKHSTSQRDTYLLSAAQSSSNEAFAGLPINRNKNRITSTVLSSSKDHSICSSKDHHYTTTSSTSSCQRKISEEVNYRKTNFHERTASSTYDHFPFDAQQLRKEWEYQRSLQCYTRSPDIRAYEKRRTHHALTATTSPDSFLPSSKHKYSEAGEAQCLRGLTYICSLDTCYQDDLDVEPSFLFPTNRQDRIIPKKQSSSMLLSDRSKSAPHLLTGEKCIPPYINKAASTTDLMQKNRPNKELCESISIKTPKSLRKENTTPLFKRMSQTSGDVFTGMVHTSLLRLETFLQKKEKEDRNILFDEMKKFDEQNLLNFVKGRDTYYVS